MTKLLIGILIGMFVSLPIGPQGIISLKRTINMGWKAGLVSGIGAATSDLIYSSTALYGYSFIDDFIKKHQYLINGITGVLFIIVGLSIYLKSYRSKNTTDDKSDKFHLTFSNFLLGLSNPLNFLIFLSIFSGIGVEIKQDNLFHNIMFIGSIFTGSVLFWFVISNIINKSTRNLKLETFFLINKVMGIIIALIGTFSLSQGIFKF